MTRDELPELHFVTPIANVASIRQLGILSNERAESLKAVSVAMPEIQERRDQVQVPGGRRLHEYANLYIHGRNPMLFKVHDRHATLCVLKVNVAVLDILGTVITNQNASSTYVAFKASPSGLSAIDRDYVYAEDWTHPDDQIQYWRHKSAKCAEVLIPDEVPPRFVDGAYVSCPEGMQALAAVAPDLPATIDGHLFFL